MKKKAVLYLLFLVIILPNKASALCSDSDIITLQKLANNISFSYTFDKKSETFNLSITNNNDKLIIEYDNTGKKYNTNNEINIKGLYSGSYMFYIYAKDSKCIDYDLRIKTVSLPYYNHLYNSELCKEIENYKYCRKWIEKYIDEDFYKNEIIKYKENLNTETKEKIKKETFLEKIKNNIIYYYSRYYLIILVLIIISVSIIIYFEDKKSNLK